MTEKHCCVIIPTYNNCNTLDKIINDVLIFTSQVIIVNDGSTDDTGNILSKYPDLDIISYPKNRGKGFALRKGFDLAREKGYKYAITIDSDGQHNANEIPSFLDELEEEPDAIIIGARNMEQESVPGKSSFGHKFSNFWFRFETGIKLPDTQSGFRLYPLDLIKSIRFFTNGFEFEIEVLVRSAWKDIRVVSVPVSVFYAPKEERVSHFRPFRDFSRVSLLNIYLVFIAIFYIKPFAFIKGLNKKNIKDFFDKQILKSKDSNIKISLSVMLGLFMGIAPVWGYQLIIAIALAFILKLNKIIVIVAANISIPPMIPLIIYASYKTGGMVLRNVKADFQHTGISKWFEDYLLPGWIQDKFPDIFNNLFQYLTGSLCFAAIVSLSFGLTTYLLLVFFRKNS